DGIDAVITEGVDPTNSQATVTARSGHDGHELWTAELPLGCSTHPRIAVLDADGDGQNEVLVNGAPNLALLSHTGSVLYANDIGGAATDTGLADFDGDGFPDLVHL